MIRLFPALLLFLLFLPFHSVAVQPDEVLDDPVLEARARELSKLLRCVVCQSENIDESNADIARDLRILVRERIVSGDSDEEALGFIVDRYGEYVLFRPPFSAANALLWLSGPLLLIAGGGLAWIFVRGRSVARPVAEPGLTDVERERLKELTGE